MQEERSEGQEAALYQNLAKVTRDQAVAAAQQALGTQAAPTKVQLGVENGYLVWEVVIGDQEVKVDAGTGQVLHREPTARRKRAPPTRSTKPRASRRTRRTATSPLDPPGSAPPGGLF